VLGYVTVICELEGMVKGEVMVNAAEPLLCTKSLVAEIEKETMEAATAE
jgi:hypothetical protein